MQSAPTIPIAPVAPASAVIDAGPEDAPAIARAIRKKETFDREEAVRAFDEVAASLESCTIAGGPRGPGSIRARFDSDGTVLHVTLGPPYAGTAVGACVAQRFQSVTITPFRSASVALNYMFNSIAP